MGPNDVPFKMCLLEKFTQALEFTQDLEQSKVCPAQKSDTQNASITVDLACYTFSLLLRELPCCPNFIF